MNSKLTKNNYILIADWMLELGLNTRELLTYALIYGFSQDDESCYYGSLEYLASWLGIKDRTNATRYLKPLVDKGLIIKKDVRTKINQKACLYKTVINRGIISEDPDSDYLVIQPFMLQELQLKGKDLLLYALVYGYSRRGSNNICSYKKDYFAKWLQCRKDHVERQVNQILDKGLIQSVKDGFIAIIPKNIAVPQTDNTPSFSNVDFTQIDNTFTHFDNTTQPKLTTNNLSLNNLKDNLNLVVNEMKEIPCFDWEGFEAAISLRQNVILEAYNYSNEGKENILNAKHLICEVINNYGVSNIEKMNLFTLKEKTSIFDEALNLTGKESLMSNIDIPERKLASTISKYIKRHDRK